MTYPKIFKLQNKYKIKKSLTLKEQQTNNKYKKTLINKK